MVLAVETAKALCEFVGVIAQDMRRVVAQGSGEVIGKFCYEEGEGTIRFGCYNITRGKAFFCAFLQEGN